MVGSSNRVGIMTQYNPPPEVAVGNAVLPSYSFTSKSLKGKIAKATWLQKVISVRFLLLFTFAFQVVIIGGVSLVITSYSTTTISKDLSGRMLDNVILRVADQIEDTFYLPFAAAKGSKFQLPTTKEEMKYTVLQPMLWNLWQQNLKAFVDIYVCTVPEGNCFGYCIFPSQFGSKESLQIYLNKTESPDQFIMPVIDDYGHSNFSDTESMFISPNYTIQNNDWWYPFIKAQKLSWTEVYFDPGFPEYLFYSIINPLVDPKTNETIGMLGIDVTSGSLLEFLQTIDVSDNAQVWIIEPSGILVASSDPDEVTNKEVNNGVNYAQDSNVAMVRESTERLLGCLKSNCSEYVDAKFSYRLHGKKIITHFRPITDEAYLNLILVVAYPESDFLGVVSYFEKVVAAVGVSALVFSVVVGLLVMRLIITPLTRLGTQMDLISGGSFETNGLVPTKLFEIHSLQQDFSRMVKALKSFGRFVPVDIVRHLLRNNAEAEPYVTQKDLTVMFSDIKSFTQMVEDMSPAQLSLLLTDYLNSMCAIIVENQGTVDKFIGDAIMALWNAPASVEHHSLKACATALKSLRALKELNTKWSAMGLPSKVETRIGIHTGKALVGNVGSKERLAFTAVGDNINLASRLEGLNKKYGTSILISGEVYEMVRHVYLCRFLDVVVVQGRSSHTHIYELVGTLSECSAQQVALCNMQYDALRCFLNRDFVEAHSLFTTLSKSMPNDLAIKMLTERSNHALQNTLPDDWTGFYVLDEK